ncbi:g3734 [Coccomyxa elongata]
MIAKMTIACLAMLALVGTSMGALDALQSVKATAQLDHSGRQLRGIDGCPGANTPPGVYINSQNSICQTSNVQNANYPPNPSPAPSGNAPPMTGGNGGTVKDPNATPVPSPMPNKVPYQVNNNANGRTTTTTTGTATMNNHSNINSGRKLLQAASIANL